MPGRFKRPKAPHKRHADANPGLLQVEINVGLSDIISPPGRSISHSRIVESNTDSAAVMAVVLPNDTLAVQLPQSSVVVRARRDEVGRVGAKGAVPDPALVAGQRGLEREGVGVTLGGGSGQVWGCLVRVRLVDGPDACRVVGAAGGEVADVRGE